MKVSQVRLRRYDFAQLTGRQLLLSGFIKYFVFPVLAGGVWIMASNSFGLNPLQLWGGLVILLGLALFFGGTVTRMESGNGQPAPEQAEPVKPAAPVPLQEASGTTEATAPPNGAKDELPPVASAIEARAHRIDVSWHPTENDPFNVAVTNNTPDVVHIRVNIVDIRAWSPSLRAYVQLPRFPGLLPVQAYFGEPGLFPGFTVSLRPLHIWQGEFVGVDVPAFGLSPGLGIRGEQRDIGIGRWRITYEVITEAGTERHHVCLEIPEAGPARPLGKC